jgi:hypothetical protein
MGVVEGFIEAEDVSRTIASGISAWGNVLFRPQLEEQQGSWLFQSGTIVYGAGLSLDAETTERPELHGLKRVAARQPEIRRSARKFRELHGDPVNELAQVLGELPVSDGDWQVLLDELHG